MNQTPGLAVLDALTGKEVYRLDHLPAWVRRASVSSDGRRIAMLFQPNGAADEWPVAVWDLPSGKEAFTLKGLAKGTQEIAFSPDNRFLVTAGEPLFAAFWGGPGLRVWDATSGEPVTKNIRTESRLDVVQVSPDGSRVIGLRRFGGLSAWEVKTGKRVYTLDPKPDSDGLLSLELARFSPDGQSVAVASAIFPPQVGPADGDSTRQVAVLILDAATGKERARYLTALDHINDLAFSGDGKLLALGGGDGTIRVHETRTGREVNVLRCYGDQVISVAFHPDGKHLIATDGGGEVKVWDVAAKQEARSFLAYRAAFTPDGRELVQILPGRKFSAWDVRIRQFVPPKRPEGSSEVQAVAYSSDDRRAALVVSKASLFGLPFMGTVKQTKVELWDRASNRKLADLTLPGGSVPWRGFLLFSPNGKYLLGKSEDGFMAFGGNAARGLPPGIIFDGTTGKVKYQLPDTLKWAAFSPDGAWLATGLSGVEKEDGLVQVQEAETGTVVRVLAENQGIRDLAFSPDGRWLGVAGNKAIVVWEVATGRKLFTLAGGHCLAFSPDGRRLATGTSGEGAVKIWDMATQQPVLSLPTRGRAFGKLAFSCDGHYLVTQVGDPIKLWDATPSPAAVAYRSTAKSLVQSLFTEQVLLEDVIGALKRADLDEPLRQIALRLAEERGDRPEFLNQTSWNIVRRPGAEAGTYQRALRYAEIACRLQPDVGVYLNTLGVAHFRVGRYADAVATLLQSDRLNRQETGSSIPADIAFLAMAYYHLGRMQEANTYWERLRTLKTSNPEDRGFVVEAEALFQGKGQKTSDPGAR
jgi:WD40 repeat protein